ncbi:MAG: Uma2 family endonuclease [Myxococcales bacterium]|nr:Uma2 family endonuclease [Myxococcales bacterium]
MQSERRRFTTDEIARMVEVGILAEDEPVELIAGELIVVSPQGPLHRALAVAAHAVLEKVFGGGFHVQDHSPIQAAPDSLPEPDVAVVRGAVRDYLDRHPSGDDVPLVVEVSVTSHRVDELKARDYAGAGVPVYWQVQVPERRLIVRSEPEGGEYRAIRIHTDVDEVEVAGTTVSVAELLP